MKKILKPNGVIIKQFQMVGSYIYGLGSDDLIYQWDEKDQIWWYRDRNAKPQNAKVLDTSNPFDI